ncbi:MAG TPA: RDD family protein [Jiangellaceae bacterium]|nr:RDD family protein [Jiangellaceae bacterium]
MTSGDGKQAKVGAHALPAEGPGSPAGWGRRFVALLIDWAIGNAVAVIIAGPAVWDRGSGLVWLPLVCWFVVVWLFTSFTGASLGQWLLRLRVIRLDRRRIGPWVGLVRTALIALVIPPLIFTEDRRGLHDLIAGTACVNGPRSSA